MSGKTIDRSILQGECIELFRAAIKSAATRDPYERRLIQFLKNIKLAPDDFIAAAKKNSLSIEKQIISFISKQNSRAQKGEITTATIGNCLKAVRVLLTGKKLDEYFHVQEDMHLIEFQQLKRFVKLLK
jgi:hypothetical protein